MGGVKLKAWTPFNFYSHIHDRYWNILQSVLTFVFYWSPFHRLSPKCISLQSLQKILIESSTTKPEFGFWMVVTGFIVSIKIVTIEMSRWNSFARPQRSNCIGLIICICIKFVKKLQYLFYHKLESFPVIWCSHFYALSSEQLNTFSACNT